MRNFVLILLFSGAAMIARAIDVPEAGVSLDVKLLSYSTKLVRVAAVVKNGPADQAGMQVDDHINSINDGAFLMGDDCIDRAKAAFHSLPTGKPAKVVISRQGKSMTVNLTPVPVGGDPTHTSVSNDMCSAFMNLEEDAINNFKKYTDTNDVASDPNNHDRSYRCKISLPGYATPIIEQEWVSRTLKVSLGEFDTPQACNLAARKMTNEIKTCFTGIYVHGNPKDDGTEDVFIGRENGMTYESPFIYLRLSKVESLNKYRLELEMPGGPRSKYTDNPNPAVPSPFATAIRTIYDDAPNDFNHCIGASRTEKGIWGDRTIYELKVLPEGAHDGSFTARSGKTCVVCRYYLGPDKAEAERTFDLLSNALFTGLGSGFAVSKDISHYEFTLPSRENLMGVNIYGRKKSRAEGFDAVVYVEYCKADQDNYAVNIVFHK